MNALDFFLANVTNEFGDKIDFSNIENEGFAGIICLGEKSAEISINIDSFTELESDLTAREKDMLDAFVYYTQSEMQKQYAFTQNIKSTQKYL